MVAALAFAFASLPNDFRTAPILTSPSTTGIQITWFTEHDKPGEVTVVEGTQIVRFVRTNPEPVAELLYSELELSERDQFPDMFENANHKHLVRLEGLRPGTTYDYTVQVGGSEYESSFRTAPDVDRPIRFVTFGDSETDPEGRDTFRVWTPGAQHPDSSGRPEGRNEYLVTETAGFDANLAFVMEAEPELLLLSGDIVQGGGYQRAWDELWRHLGPVTSQVPFVPALGNWENYGARNGEYEPWAVAAARAKYRAHFDFPPNGTPAYRDTYYRIDYGPVTVMTLDSSNGLPQGTDWDTNINIDEATYPADDLPDVGPGSPQWNWVRRELESARADGQVIFVQFHHIPYSSGGHAVPTTVPGSSGQAGIAMRAYTPMFQEFGVVAVFCGHNESFERSQVGDVLFYDVGVAGDGLGFAIRDNPWRQWVAHFDAPELWDGDRLIAGGKHYGHLVVDVVPKGDVWEVTFTPIHSFPVTDVAGEVVRFERRAYDDVVTVARPRQ